MIGFSCMYRMYQEVSAELLENILWISLSQNKQMYPCLKFNCYKIQTGEVLMKGSCYMFINNWTIKYTKQNFISFLRVYAVFNMHE
jgi:hypothetical protein